MDQSFGGITNDFKGILFKTFCFLKFISGSILLLGIKLKNIKLFYPWIILNCITILLSLVGDWHIIFLSRNLHSHFQIMIVIIFLGLGEVSFGFTKKEAIVTGGIAIALIVVTFPALVFITNRFNVSLVYFSRTKVNSEKYFSYCPLPIPVIQDETAQR